MEPSYRVVVAFEMVTLWLTGILVVIPIRRLLLSLRRSPQTQTYSQEFYEFSEFSTFVALFIGQGSCLLFDRFTEDSHQLGSNSTLRWLVIWFVSLVPFAAIPLRNRRRAVIAGAISIVPLEFLNRNGLSKLPRYFPPTISLEAIVYLLVAISGAYGIAFWLDNLLASRKQPSEVDLDEQTA